MMGKKEVQPYPAGKFNAGKNAFSIMFGQVHRRYANKFNAGLTGSTTLTSRKVHH
jgi:hypothetical protein